MNNSKTAMSEKKRELLKQPIVHMDMTKHNVVSLVDAMGNMAFQARNLNRAAKIYEMMLRDQNSSVILCLAGSLISAGLKKIILQMVRDNMVDAIVSTGANIVDQDYFEGLGFNHYVGTPFVDDHQLRELNIDRIYDTYIDEDDLRYCDDPIAEIAGTLEHRPYSSREFIWHMGEYLSKKGKNKESIVLACYEMGVPVFVPAFSDCSAGFGLVHHQWHNPKKHVTIDSTADFRELTKIKIESGDTGLLMIGGGVPKNFAQDVVVAAEVLGHEVAMHKYAVQLTVADERDGALSGSTLKEACSWGKVDTAFEQMVFGEATINFPLVAAYAWHKGAHKDRKPKRFADKL